MKQEEQPPTKPSENTKKGYPNQAVKSTSHSQNQQRRDYGDRWCSASAVIVL